jgi:hypothetical protein
MFRNQRVIFLMLGVCAGSSSIAGEPNPTSRSFGPCVVDYASIQAAIDANPGRPVHIPPGDYEIRDPLRIRTDSSGLIGPGRIVQANAERPILVIENASNVLIRDLTLTRNPNSMETMAEGIIAIGCRDLIVDGVKVLDNRTRSSAIELRECESASVRNCLVRNYHRVSVDDRTQGTNYGYAFRCMIGTGLMVRESRGTLIQGNRIVEENLIPTPEIRKKFGLGDFVKKAPTKGPLVSQVDWDRGFTANWMQGSAIVVTSPTSTDLTRILGNFVQYTGQGIDIHADRVIVSQNIIHDTLVGVKAMHGSRNVLITGNQFSGNSLWSIGLMPGIASHPATPTSKTSPGVVANHDGGSIIANNIISDFGLGQTAWIWGSEGGNGFPIRFDRGQESDDPPLSDVLIQGNIVSDSGKQGIRIDGVIKVVGPRYQYAVLIEQGDGSPVGLHFLGNILHPGTRGVSNVDLKP